MASLLNHMMADKVTGLLDDPLVCSYPPEVARFYPRDTALKIIHAAIWGFGSREDSTAGFYAGMMLFDAIGLKNWTFDEDESEVLNRFRREKAAVKRAEWEAATPTPDGSGEGRGEGVP